jgi:hypothetical protein
VSVSVKKRAQVHKKAHASKRGLFTERRVAGWQPPTPSKERERAMKMFRSRSNTDDIATASDTTLERLADEADRTLAEIRRAGTPATRTEQAEVIARAESAAQVRDAARAEMARREPDPKPEPRWSDLARDQKRRQEGAEKSRADHKEFVREIAAEKNARVEQERARKIKEGLVWTPAGEGGGDAVAAVFSSAFVWDSTVREIRDGKLIEPLLDTRALVALWWALNLIEASGGVSATIPNLEPGRRPPGWPAYDVESPDGMKLRLADVKQLEANGYITIVNHGATVMLTHGERTRSLLESFREHWRKAS